MSGTLGWGLASVAAGVLAAVVSPVGLIYALTSFSLLAGLCFCGHLVSGRADGVLINERRVMSLARFQTALWTVVVLGAWIALVIARARCGATHPETVGLCQELWWVLGISTAGLVGTPLLLAPKKEEKPTDKAVKRVAKAQFMANSKEDAVERAETRLEVAGKTPTDAKAESAAVTNTLAEAEEEVKAAAVGTLVGNTSVADARFRDMFEGDELGNSDVVDIAKVQMFYFTVIAAAIWVIAFMKLLATEKPNDVTGLPCLSEGLVVLMGISNAGYLGNKATSKTPTTK